MGIPRMKKSCYTCRYNDTEGNNTSCWHCSTFDKPPLHNWTPKESDMGHDNYEKWLEDTWKAMEANHRTMMIQFEALAKILKENQRNRLTLNK